MDLSSKTIPISGTFFIHSINHVWKVYRNLVYCKLIPLNNLLEKRSRKFPVKNFNRKTRFWWCCKSFSMFCCVWDHTHPHIQKKTSIIKRKIASSADIFTRTWGLFKHYFIGKTLLHLWWFFFPNSFLVMVLCIQ